MGGGAEGGEFSRDMLVPLEAGTLPPNDLVVFFTIALVLAHFSIFSHLLFHK